MVTPRAVTRSAGSPYVLVTLPVHNEAERLTNSVRTVHRTLQASGLNFGLAIAEDGSTDGTLDCIRLLKQQIPELLVQTNREKRGRGWALRTLWANTQADFYAFSDADFSAEPSYLLRAIEIATRGCDVVTGSRYVPGAVVIRPPARSLVSKSYNWLVRSIFKDGIKDHQCGLKVLTRSARDSILPLSREDSWFWDTEILVLARELGLSIFEFPVRWEEMKTRRTEVLRLLSDLRLHGVGIMKLISTKSKARALAPDGGTSRASDQGAG